MEKELFLKLTQPPSAVLAMFLDGINSDELQIKMVVLDTSPGQSGKFSMCKRPRKWRGDVLKLATLNSKSFDGVKTERRPDSHGQRQAAGIPIFRGKVI
jgi:hypothetical protein